jgi:acetolactate synthase-1/3 small subunit
VVEGDNHTLEQVTKQLNKLINVLKVSDISQDESVNRELVLIKIHAEPSRRTEIMQIVETFRAKIIDFGKQSIIVEITGDDAKVNALIELLREFGVKEVARTGKVSLVRGGRTLKIGSNY